jgi:hypothetical protein
LGLAARWIANVKSTPLASRGNDFPLQQLLVSLALP